LTVYRRKDENKKALDRTIKAFRGFTSCLDETYEIGITFGKGALNVCTEGINKF
jgi:hypothetical protein